MSTPHSHEPINCEPLKRLIRSVPDFPKPGILFYDITTVLKDKAGFAQLIDAFASYYIDKEVILTSCSALKRADFIFGPALAYRLNSWLRARAQAPASCPREDADRPLRPGVRLGFIADSQGRHPAWPTRHHCRRSRWPPVALCWRPPAWSNSSVVRLLVSL